MWMTLFCDMVKGNESDVAEIAFEILAKKESQLFCFILFWELINLSSTAIRVPFNISNNSQKYLSLELNACSSTLDVVGMPCSYFGDSL